MMRYPVSFPRKCFYIPLLLLLILVQLSGIFTYCPLFMMFFLPSAAPLVAQMVKCLPAMRETRVQFLGQEDSPGEGNGNPLQHSCLENPMDGGA